MIYQNLSFKLTFQINWDNWNEMQQIDYFPKAIQLFHHSSVNSELFKEMRETGLYFRRMLVTLRILK